MVLELGDPENPVSRWRSLMPGHLESPSEDPREWLTASLPGLQHAGLEEADVREGLALLRGLIPPPDGRAGRSAGVIWRASMGLNITSFSFKV